MSDLECPLTELPPAQCACPKHRGGHAPGEELIETVGQPFTASYAGPCARGCELGILHGELIAHVANVDGFGYMHVGRCP